jgi:hypothetical protein
MGPTSRDEGECLAGRRGLPREPELSPFEGESYPGADDRVVFDEQNRHLVGVQRAGLPRVSPPLRRQEES